MTSPFAVATFTYVSGRVNFQNATGLKMPFQGAVVVPRPAVETPPMDQMSAQQSLFAPLRYPRHGAAGARMFPTLRAMDGTRLSLTDNALIFVSEDPGGFGDFDLTNVFSKGTVTKSIFPETGTLTSARPKYLVLALSGGAQPTDAEPKMATDGQSLANLGAGLPASLTGTLMAFDFSGLEIEADAALAALGVTNVAGAPGGNDVRVQFVDILGKPLAKDALFGLGLTPAPQGPDTARKVYKLPFAGSGRTMTIRLSNPIPGNVSADDKYLWGNIKVAVWPGHGARLTPVSHTAPDFNIAEGATGTPPPFLRLCVFHPSQIAQDEYGGLLDEKARFTRDKGTTPASGFALQSEADDFVVFNDGESYLDNLYDAIDTAASGDRLYITNWASHAHLHMRGTLGRMGLGPVDIDVSEADSVLQEIDQNRFIVQVGADKKAFLALPDRLDRGGSVEHGLQFETRLVPAAGIADTALAKGFFRPDGILAFPMLGVNDQPAASRLILRWKNLAGEVSNTELSLGTGIAPLSTPEILAVKELELGITADDPPAGTVIRKNNLADFRTALGGASGSLWLMVVNTSTGRHVVHDLTVSDTATDVVLGELPDDTSAADALYALVLNADPRPTDTLENLVVSHAVEIKYTSSQHANGAIPLADEELGGLLRRAISRGVEVRAMYWDQFQANIGNAENLASGHSNNEELTSIINTDRNGKRGWAVRDRSTRAFGSFHQKALVLVSGTVAAVKVTAWLGGIDLANGRWDTELHLEQDPDRLGGKWWDTQVRLAGPAATEVLRNFAQRWRAIGEFINDPMVFDDCIPVGPELGVAQDTTTNVIEPPKVTSLDRALEPSANVQITRTCPPRSCHAEIPKAANSPAGEPLGEIARDGELGSLASYLKAISLARRFILINDQYFFSPEIALALHKAMTKPDGPSALLILLPKDLGEDPRIDPMLFKLREKCLHILFHGGTYTPPPAQPGVVLPDIRRPHCGRVTANTAGANSPVAAKTAVLFARNRAGKPIYVHAKTMIVDDVWMSIGSANLNCRSTTYDFEINAGIVGDRLEFGGTDVVRQQRVEIARRMLGLPAAFAPLIVDPEVMFAQFKALEAKGTSPAHKLYPLEPMSQKLDPAYKKKVGDAAFDGNVDVVSALGMNDPIIDGIACTITDPDGRAKKEALAPFVGIIGNSIRAYARITLTVGCQATASTLINNGTDIFVEIRVQEGNGTFRRAHRIALEFAGQIVEPSPAAGDPWVGLSTEETVTIEARLLDAADAPQGCGASDTVDPNQTLILPGSVHDILLNIA
jgi:phosphatidylserine/phosphatidylglycerophosphate/cardiolipin synthase-like enzyme